MKFFLPLATSDEQAERVYSRIANRLKELGYELTSHRIAKVIYRREGKLVSDAVGAGSENGEVVLAIFKNDVGYFICTYSRGAVWGEPITARYTVVESAEAFDEEQIDQKEPG